MILLLGMWSILAINVAINRVASMRTWKCNELDEKWGEKTYELKDQDFCKAWWYGTLGLGPNSKPDCDPKVAPIISFYDSPADEPLLLCSIDMNEGKTPEYEQCIKKVATGNYIDGKFFVISLYGKGRWQRLIWHINSFIIGIKNKYYIYFHIINRHAPFNDTA